MLELLQETPSRKGMKARYEELKAAGLCVSCRAPRNLYALHCDACHVARREATRKRMGMRPWRPGGKGRRPRDFVESETSTST